VDEIIEEIRQFKKNIGEKIEINGQKYTFHILQDGGGDWAVFYSDEYQIWATPYFWDKLSTPIEIKDKDGNDIPELCGELYGSLFVDWDDYKKRVVEKATELFNKAETKMVLNGEKNERTRRIR